MVSNTRRRTAFVLAALYLLAGLLIGYFGFHAYSGSRGLKAQQDLAEQLSRLRGELASFKAERADWQRRVELLRGDNLDPDMLDERARAMLDYAHPRDLVFSGKGSSGEIVTGSIPGRSR